MSRLQGNDQTPPTLVVPLRATESQACRASGWGMLRGSTDGGHIVCPVCDQHVVATQDTTLGPAVCVIGEHDA